MQRRGLGYMWTCMLALAAPACGGGATSTLGSDDAVSPAARARLGVIREIEDHRWFGDPRLRSALQGAPASVEKAAAIAVGRIGDASLAPNVIALLQAASPSVRESAAL